MKIALIGANGNLGSRIARQALNRGFEVRGFLYNGETPDDRAEIVHKSLFDLTKEDLAGCGILVSAYGSGFHADPALNHKAFQKYIALCRETGCRLIAIGGAGSLFTDETHTMYCYETSGYPDFLRGISTNIKLGIDDLKKTEDINWTVVCPSSDFDPEGPFTGNYQVGEQGHLLYNDAGESYVTYDDLAKAMLDIAENNTYQRMMITVVTKKEK